MNVTVTLTKMECDRCGGVFAISSAHENYCHRERGPENKWFCPYCGVKWWYGGKTDAQKLRDQLARERAQHDQTRAELESTEARRRAEKAAKTRLKKRIAAGVCPCCKRHFENLARHIESKHPGYARKEETP